MIITRTSPVTNITRTMHLPVTEAQLEAWEGGGLIQNTFPDLTPGQREFLKTGITDEEWDYIFGHPDE